MAKANRKTTKEDMALAKAIREGRKTKKVSRKAVDPLQGVLERRKKDILSGKEAGITEEAFLAELRKEFP